METTKICTSCNKEKSLKFFNKNKNFPDGLQYQCKQCHTEKTKQYSRTKLGIITKIYSTQRANSKKRNHELPKYTKAELKVWLLKNPKFHILFSNWENSNYETDLFPSLDRINNSKGYSFDNIQIVTWKENRDNAARDIKEDVIKGICKTVYQYDLNMNLVNVFKSTQEASKETGIHRFSIRSSCNGTQKTAGGFIWRF